MHSRISKFIIISVFLLTCSPLFAFDKVGRLGIGMTNQLKNDFPALSFKMQKNRSFALGGMFGFSSDSEKGGYGAGLKFYRNIFRMVD